MLHCNLFTSFFIFSLLISHTTQVHGIIQVLQIITMGGALSWIQKRVMGEEDPVYNFPSTFDGFGYYFNKDGQLRQKETDEPFQFNVREGDHRYNQQHYNAFGEIITEKVYQMLEKECKLQRAYLPVDAEDGEPRSFVFISGDLYTNKDKLMILIHGNGVVRAGQWARRLIINDCLDSGTQIPYIKWARENGYSVIVANPNLNTDESKGSHKKKPVPIRGNTSPEEHTESLWREFVQRCPAEHIAIVAHSYGGVSTLELAKNHLREFEERVFAVALTDSVHGLRQQEAEPEVVSYYKQHVVNWASAYDPLDAPLITSTDEVPTVSAGTDRHENTSYASMHSIFKFFKEKYEQTVSPSNKHESAEDLPPPMDTETSGQGEVPSTKSSNQDEVKEQIDQSDTEVKECDQEPAEQDLQESESSSASKPEDSAVTVDDIKADVKTEL